MLSLLTSCWLIFYSQSGPKQKLLGTFGNKDVGSCEAASHILRRFLSYEANLWLVESHAAVKAAVQEAGELAVQFASGICHRCETDEAQCLVDNWPDLGYWFTQERVNVIWKILRSCQSWLNEVVHSMKSKQIRLCTEGVSMTSQPCHFFLG